VSVSKFAEDNHIYFGFDSSTYFFKSQVNQSVLLTRYLGPNGLY